MKTIDVRVLVPDDVDERYFVEQLVTVSRGPGAPYGAALLEIVVTPNPYHNDCGDDVDVNETHVYTNDEAYQWQGEQLSAVAEL